LPRKKSIEPPRVHTGIRLDAAILERLGKGDGGVSEEIRARLMRTFAEDDLDAVTRELRDGLGNLAAKLAADFGNEWHASPRAYEAFAAGVAQRIAGYMPSPKEGVGASDLFALNEPADMIGRMREHDDRQEHDYPQLKSATARRRRTLIARGSKARKGD
jgi:hypothetical protein